MYTTTDESIGRENLEPLVLAVGDAMAAVVYWGSDAGGVAADRSCCGSDQR
jgi:hypothetical protein